MLAPVKGRLLNALSLFPPTHLHQHPSPILTEWMGRAEVNTAAKAFSQLEITERREKKTSTQEYLLLISILSEKGGGGTVGE